MQLWVWGGEIALCAFPGMKEKIKHNIDISMFFVRIKKFSRLSDTRVNRNTNHPRYMTSPLASVIRWFVFRLTLKRRYQTVLRIFLSWRLTKNIGTSISCFIFSFIPGITQPTLLITNHDWSWTRRYLGVFVQQFCKSSDETQKGPKMEECDYTQ